MLKNKQKTYRIQISAATENLQIIRSFIQEVARKAGFNDEQIDQIKLAVDEACTNAIKHAYHFDASKMIDLQIRLDSKKIDITITDNGPGFNPERLDQPDINKNARKAKPGGLGIHLMKTLMDDVRFHIIPGQKTEVHLIKYRSDHKKQKSDLPEVNA